MAPQHARQDEVVTRLSRRQWLGWGLSGGLGLALAACGGGAAPTSAPAKTDSKPAEAKPAATAAPKAEEKKPDAAAKPAESKPTEAKPAAGGARRGGTLNYAEAGDFNNFNPWAVGAVNLNMYNQVFSRLLWKDGGGKENPDLAESWELAKDGLSFRAKLRSGVKWHDGKDFTADDFVTMFGYTKDETLIKDAAIKKHQGLIAPIKEVKAPDKQTVEFVFDKPVPYITDILDYWFAIRIDDKADPSFTKKVPVGTGPFKMVEWTPNQYAKFARHDAYHNRELPNLDEFMFRRLEKAETLIPNLRSRTLDGIQVTSLSDVATLKADANYGVEISENAGSLFNLMVNVRKPPFDKKEVRQALSYSLNRVEMAKSAFFGVSRPITSPFYSPSSLAFREDLVMAHAFDLDRAASLLKQAGVSGLQMTANATPRWPQMKLFLLMWQQDLAKIGVKLTVNEVEVAKFYDIGGAKDLLGADVHPWLNARTTRDPAIFWSTQVNYRGGANSSYGYVNEELEKLVGEGAVEPDPAKRKTIYQKLNELVVDQSHVIHVATDPRVWVFSKQVSDVRIDLLGNLFLDRASIAR